MSKYNLNMMGLLSDNLNFNFYRGWDDYDDYYGRPYPPPPPRDRYDYGPPRRSNNNWRPTYSKRDRKKYDDIEPKDSARFIFNLFKRLTEFFLIITGLAFFVTSICYLLIGALSSSQIQTISKYYFIDITTMSWVFGSIAGIITGFLFLILFILQRINKRGWLRKTPLKVHITWFLSFVIITLLSIYFLFVVSSNSWSTTLKQPFASNFTNSDVEKIYTTITEQVKKATENDFMKKLIDAYCNNSIGIIATGAISIGVDLFIVIVASIYFRGINDVLDDSYDYFDSMYRR
ncbi:MAG: hypothetical protein K2F52_01200 [Malacoplasma sp.]|nr:hypothetical protein [Malacoplasma sp.]